MEMRDVALLTMITGLGFSSHHDFDTQITLTDELRTVAVSNVEIYRYHSETPRKNAPPLTTDCIEKTSAV
jgi:hypothetical protein